MSPVPSLLAGVKLVRILHVVMDQTKRGSILVGEGLPVSCEAPELRAVLWENPTYGISGGAAGNVDYGGSGILPLNRKSGVVMNLHLRLRAPVLHPTWNPGMC
jgi:hypothetical protein